MHAQEFSHILYLISMRARNKQQIQRVNSMNLLGFPAAVWGWLTGLPMTVLGFAIAGEGICNERAASVDEC